MKYLYFFLIGICVASFIFTFFWPNNAHCDVLLSVTAKYGVTGYNTEFSPGSSNSSTTVSNHGKSKNNSTSTTVTTTGGTLDIDNKYQLVPGLMLQTMPENRYDLSIGAGIYMDSTVNMFLGIRL